MAIHALVGSSSSIQQLRQYLPKLAQSNASVLITGETGTGKECVAEILHRQGPRKSGSFVCVNCAAVPDSLFESEMFGYEAGAFTGASRRFDGKFKSASGGTIFLDEIGDMTLLAQAKILRVLETREVTPLGGRTSVPVDVRVIAATNQDLEPLVQARSFRLDLFYRLNVARLHLQPLRERREDIPELLEYFISQFNERLHLQVRPPSTEVLKSLMKYEWPGNVREVRNLVEAIFIDPPAGATGPLNLPEFYRKIFERFTEDAVPERELLLKILHQTRWNKKQAAVEMNWSRMTLYRKLAKYNISPQQGNDPEART
jgi:DNA-binding NtrC family response regulator